MKCPRCGLVHAPLEEVCRRCEIDLRSGEPRPRSRAPSAPVAVKVSPFARIKEQIADKTRARRASPAPTAAPAPEAGPAAASVEKKTKTEPATVASAAAPKPAVAVFSLAKRMRKAQDKNEVTERDLLIAVPSFVISELKQAFQIGFILFVPFLVIDMVVANILLALGMHMLSPTVISMPFKLLLFVLVDGWYLITKGLVVSYL